MSELKKPTEVNWFNEQNPKGLVLSFTGQPYVVDNRLVLAAEQIKAKRVALRMCRNRSWLIVPGHTADEPRKSPPLPDIGEFSQVVRTLVMGKDERQDRGTYYIGPAGLYLYKLVFSGAVSNHDITLELYSRSNPVITRIERLIPPDVYLRQFWGRK